MAKKKKAVYCAKIETTPITCTCGEVVGKQILAKYDNTKNSIDSGGDSYSRVFFDTAYKDNFGNVLKIKNTN